MTARRELFRRAQWRVLVAVMVCYLFYYMGRNALGFAIPGIAREMGLDKQALGWVSAGMLWAYAAGQVLSGNMGDWLGGRKMMTAGAVLSLAMNWATSFATGFSGLLLGWSANGLAQSMGWAPGSRMVANWWGAHERGWAFGFFVLAAGLSSVLAFVAALLVLEVCLLDWRWLFRLPVLLMLPGALVAWRLARDRPSELGFADLEDERDGARSAARQADAGSRSGREDAFWARYREALGNGRLVLAGLAVGFQNAARYGLLIWVPVYFLGDAQDRNSWVCVGLPVGMALGALASGWISDRFCGSRRSGVIASFMVLATVCSMAMWLLPAGCWAGVPVLFLAGFFAYGPQSTFWALAADLLGRERTGTAVGVMNFFAYLMAGLCEPLIGWVIQSNPLGRPGIENPGLVFPMVAGLSVCSAAIAWFVRR